MLKLLQEISQKINVPIVLKLKEKNWLSEKVKILLDFGLVNQQIAGILGISKGSIGVIKSRLKLKKK